VIVWRRATRYINEIEAHTALFVYAQSILELSDPSKGLYKWVALTSTVQMSRTYKYATNESHSQVLYKWVALTSSLQMSRTYK